MGRFGASKLTHTSTCGEICSSDNLDGSLGCVECTTTAFVVFGLDCDAVFGVAASNRHTYCLMKLDGKCVITPTGTSTSSKPLSPSIPISLPLRPLSRFFSFSLPPLGGERKRVVDPFGFFGQISPLARLVPFRSNLRSIVERSTFGAYRFVLSVSWPSIACHA